MANGPILAIDPGRDKCGLAVVGPGGVLAQAVVPLDLLPQTAAALAREHQAVEVVLGNGTAAQEAEARLRRALPRLPLSLVDEAHSSEEGRRRYFQAHPPRGWRRLIPRGLLTPPRPYDDFVAVVLAERYLAGREEKTGDR